MVLVSIYCAVLNCHVLDCYIRARKIDEIYHMLSMLKVFIIILSPCLSLPRTHTNIHTTPAQDIMQPDVDPSSNCIQS